jgi:hypothetical protein
VLRGRSRPPARSRRACAASPARIRQVRGRSSTYGTSTLVPRVHLLVLLAGPGPSGSADPSRRCRGCSHPPWRLPGKAAPSFTSLLRQASGGVLAPPLGQTEPRGAPQDLTIPRTDARREPSRLGPVEATRGCLLSGPEAAVASETGMPQSPGCRQALPVCGTVDGQRSGCVDS